MKEQHPHRRRNALTGDWVLVSPHRSLRPWQGLHEASAGESRPQHDPACYLCAGNTRANGESNPAYKGTHVFQNDFAALLSEEVPAPDSEEPLFRAKPIRGECRVVCFSPRHDLTLARMELPAIRRVIDTWSEQTVELSRKWRWVQVFENKGGIMGCSNPHPHGQIWASDDLPHEIVKETREQTEYFQQTGRLLLSDYAAREEALGERVIESNAHWLTVIPYWAVWPYEVLLLPKAEVKRLPDLDDAQRVSLAEILRAILVRYDNLFGTSFPYSMGWHGAPFHGTEEEAAGWQLHAHFFPPLLRSATVKKFMVGYEMLAEPQRDLTPEMAANRLRETASIHYLGASV